MGLKETEGAKWIGYGMGRWAWEELGTDDSDQNPMNEIPQEL